MDLFNVSVSGNPIDRGLVSRLVKSIMYTPLQWPHLLSLCACLILGGLYLRKLPLPPGPSPLPIIGNIHQLLSKPLPELLLEWHQKYGPIISFRSGSRLMVSIASHDVCQDLMLRKGTLYNSRPEIVVAGRHATRGLHIALMPFGKKWQAHRRILASVTTENASRKYRQLEEVESLQVMINLLTSNDFLANFRQAEIHQSEQLTYRIMEVLFNFHFALGEIFPVLDYLPGFLAPWKAFGKGFYSEATSLYSRNLLKAQSTSSWNWVKHSLTRPEARDMPTDELSMLFGASLQAAFETVPSVLRVFVKAMLLHPECVVKAQTELDQIVGSDRVPSFSDMPSLPYIKAIVNECCRWQAVIPLGVPHCNTRGDEYGGYRFSKGTTVFANTWAIGFNEGLYRNARDFLPERWVENPELPNSAPFGYGRRVCLGKFIGRDSLFINIARLLWGYKFAHGEREVALWDIDHAFSSSPRDFDAKFSIRSAKHHETLERAWAVTDTDPNVILGKIATDYQA
ncbi:cytochrome P450 [Penicillium alfredii]|uniref:Cytochrome P450 n=1 Tax=Penicillium alfredii TaxID=1506179 RepID=A0A9W9KPS1_9EURO|nr:cytochrome P450 [Penicillium alfredii]KAJ5114719.1 cytochrome P450 [Penicillium alfredii]